MTDSDLRPNRPSEDPQLPYGLERFADFVFLLGLALMVVASFMLAYKLG